MKTNNAIINSIMKNAVKCTLRVKKNTIKYLCAVLLVIGTCAQVLGATYQRVTSWSDLSSGDVVIFANSGQKGAVYVMGTTKVNDNKYEGVSATVSNSGEISTTDALEMTIKFNGGDIKQACAFCIGSGGTAQYPESYWLGTDGTNNHIKTITVENTYASTSVSSGNSQRYCWGTGEIASTTYRASMPNTTDGTLYLKMISGNDFTASSTGTATNVAIFKKSCTEPTLTLSPSSKTMNFGAGNNTFTITPTTNSSGGKTWRSSNTDVATVSSSGVVTVVAAGTATIYCKVAEVGGYCEKEVGCSLTVNAVAPTVNCTGLTVGTVTSSTAAFSGGKVTATGGKAITKYGYVVGASSSVTWNDKVADGTFSGSINLNTAFGSKTVTGLSPNTTYYVRPYAYNGSQYGYCDAQSFTTLQRYTITYNNNGGGGTISAEYKDHGATVTLNNGNNFSKTGYTLNRWDTNTGGDGTSYALSGNYSANSNVTLYAIWQANGYIISLDNQSPTTASTPTQINVTYDASTNLTGTVVTTLPTKTGYTFGGYYTNKNGAGTQIITDEGVVVASAGSGTYTDASRNWKYANDLTVYANWIANDISLTLSRNGVTGTDGSATVKFDAAALTSGWTDATNSDANYHLVGYYAEQGCSTKVLESNGNFAATNVSGYITGGKWSRATSPTTLYAKWAQTIRTVTFNMNGHGEQVPIQEVESGTPATRPSPDPTAEDWRFLGWFDAAEGGNEWNFSIGITTNTTIHAHWEEISYSDDYIAWCEPNISITGDVHLTSTNGVSVYLTSDQGGWLNISSTDLSGVEKLEIKYLDADNGYAEVASASSLFRLCSSSDYNVADETQIDVSGSNTCDLNYSIRYTPSAHGVINHYQLQIAMKRGSGAAVRTLKTVTHDLYGRSLPEDFVVASKLGGVWYALPNNLESTEGNAKAVEGIRIVVDNEGTPTKATCAPDITVYHGENRYTASHRYAIRLTDGSRHLMVSTTPSKNEMWLSPDGSADKQDWYLSSSTFGAYEVTIPSVGTKKLGMYGGNIGYYASPTSPSGQIYFLPIDNILEDIPASVTEWGQQSVILDVDAQAASSAQVRLGAGAAEEAATFEQTLTSVKSAASKFNYTLTFTTMDFSSHKGELLYVDWLDDLDNVIGTSQVTIPWIIASDGTMSAIDATKGHWDTEVHVLPGVTLTADGGSFGSSIVVVKQLEIYPGATVKVTTGTLTATTLSLRNGWTRASSKRYDVARLYIDGSANLGLPTNAYADWYIDYDQYYPVAVPWAVTTSGMTYLNSTNAASGGVRMRYYDGNSRATNVQTGVGDGANWKEYSPLPSTLSPSVGYAMTARRPSGKAFSIIRMPMTIPSVEWITGGEKGNVSTTHKDQVDVTAYGVKEESETPYAEGWNLIANPYMSIYQGTLSLSPTTGDATTVNFVNIPDVDFKEYDQLATETAKLNPASAFLIQASKTGTITFGTANRKPSAPSYRMDEEPISIPEQKAYIVLSGETAEDMMGILVSDKYTADYEINADLEKLLSDGTSLRTYMRYGDMNMAYLAINELLAKEWIPVTVRIPADGEYTFSLHDASIASELEGVYLIDYQNGDKVTNLIENSYTFSAEAGTISGRFAINAIVGEHEIPTGIDAIQAGADIDSDKPFKFIYHDKVYVLYNRVMYDVTGKKVREINK